MGLFLEPDATVIQGVVHHRKFIIPLFYVTSHPPYISYVALVTTSITSTIYPSDAPPSSMNFVPEYPPPPDYMSLKRTSMTMINNWKENWSNIYQNLIHSSSLISIRIPIMIQFRRVSPSTSPYTDTYTDPYSSPSLVFHQPCLWQSSASKWKQEQKGLTWRSIRIRYSDVPISLAKILFLLLILFLVLFLLLLLFSMRLISSNTITSS